MAQTVQAKGRSERERPSGRVTEHRRLQLEPYLFVLPALIIYGLFSFGPVLATVLLSFFRWELFTPTTEFIGLRHYSYVLRDARFWNALRNNLVFLGLAVTIPVAMGLLLAVAIATITRGRTLYRFLFYLPVVFSGVVIAFVWAWIYHPTAGLLNSLLDVLGLEVLQQSWLGNPRIVLGSIFVAYLWSTFGYSMVIFLAGLQGIDPELHDAATVDGVTFWQRLRYITIPSLHDVITFAITLKIVGAFAVVGIVFVMTGGGPNFASDVVGVYVFRMIGNLEMGWATAAATINGIIIVTVVLVFMKRREYQHG